MEWPQITLIILIASNLGVVLAKDGKSSGTHSFFTSCISTAITAWLLIVGGFFN